MATKVVFFDEMQEADVVERDDSAKLADVTTRTDKVVYVPVGERTRIVCAWNYAYHRIPITGIAKDPEFQVRDSRIPTPSIENVRIDKDWASGKAWIIAFDVVPKVVDSWECNLASENYYDDPIRGPQTHRRYQYFTVSTQRDISIALDEIK